MTPFFVQSLIVSATPLYKRHTESHCCSQSSLQVLKVEWRYQVATYIYTLSVTTPHTCNSFDTHTAHSTQHTQHTQQSTSHTSHTHKTAAYYHIITIYQSQHARRAHPYLTRTKFFIVVVFDDGISGTNM